MFVGGLVLMIFFPLSSLANTMRECHEKEGLLIKQDPPNRQACEEPLNVNLQGMSDGELWRRLKDSIGCDIRRTIRYSEESCVPVRKASMKVQTFLWQQQLREVQDAESGRITLLEMLDRIKRNISLIMQENEQGLRQVLQELNQVNQREAEIRASQRIERSLSILGAMPSSSGGGVRRYIFNGRHISCYDQGGYTICN